MQLVAHHINFTRALFDECLGELVLLCQGRLLCIEERLLGQVRKKARRRVNQCRKTKVPRNSACSATSLAHQRLCSIHEGYVLTGL